MNKKGKSRLIHARLLEHEKLDVIMEFFQARYRKVFGKESKRHVPVALAIDFAVDLTADLISNPDLYVASESGTLANLNETLTAEVQKQVVNILKQIGVPCQTERTPDGGFDITVYKEDGQPSHLVKMSPEVLRAQATAATNANSSRHPTETCLLTEIRRCRTSA